MTDAGYTLLDRSTGERLVRYARAVIEAELDGRARPASPFDDGPATERRGAFVTLKREDDLRGCIGRPRPRLQLPESVAEAAVGAATDDPRFPTLGPAELPSVTVSVSALTKPQSIDVTDPQAYADAIEVGRDGVIVEQEGRRGLLLPQVAVEQGWDVTTFIEQTCRKARLRPAAWKDERTSIRRFSAQVFEETAPDGEISETNFLES
jgi:hypothetical protein